MRLHQSSRPAKPEQTELRNHFWAAPEQALLDRRTVAAGLSRSTGWLELRATKGDGPPFLKMGTHRVLYRKNDVLAWFDVYAKRLTSTSAGDMRDHPHERR